MIYVAVLVLLWVTLPWWLALILTIMLAVDSQ